MKPASPIPPLPRAALPDHMRESFDRALALRGDATFIGVAGHAPELFDWYADFYQKVFYGGRVARRYKELLRFRLSTAHGCAFCNKGNRVDAAAAGVTDAELRVIDDPANTLWSPADRAVLKIAGEMMLTNPRGALSSELYAEARQHFDEAQIFELGMTMAVLTGMAKFLFVYDLVEKEHYCEYGAKGA